MNFKGPIELPIFEVLCSYAKQVNPSAYMGRVAAAFEHEAKRVGLEHDPNDLALLQLYQNTCDALNALYAVVREQEDKL